MTKLILAFLSASLGLVLSAMVAFAGGAERCNNNFGTQPTYDDGANGCHFELSQPILGGIHEDWWLNGANGRVNGPAVVTAQIGTLYLKDPNGKIPIMPASGPVAQAAPAATVATSGAGVANCPTNGYEASRAVGMPDADAQKVAPFWKDLSYLGLPPGLGWKYNPDMAGPMITIMVPPNWKVDSSRGVGPKAARGGTTVTDFVMTVWCNGDLFP